MAREEIVKYICDRCGAEACSPQSIKDWTQVVLHADHDSAPLDGEDFGDLCPECFASLEAWKRDGKVEA